MDGAIVQKYFVFTKRMSYVFGLSKTFLGLASLYVPSIS